MVHIRSSANDIGQTTIGHVASVRQRYEEMLECQRKAEEQNSTGLDEFSFNLEVEELDDDSVLKIDLTPLYRAYHIHNCLGILEQFLPTSRFIILCDSVIIIKVVLQHQIG